MALRMRRQEPVTIPLSDGEWIVIRSFLTEKQQRKAQSRLLSKVKLGDGSPDLDHTEVAHSLCVAYLLDWSAKDVDGSPIEIKDYAIQGETDFIADALGNLPYEAADEIWQAISKYAEEQSQEKKVPTNGNGSLTTSSSPSDVIGVTSG